MVQQSIHVAARCQVDPLLQGAHKSAVRPRLPGSLQELLRETHRHFFLHNRRHFMQCSISVLVR